MERTYLRISISCKNENPLAQRISSDVCNFSFHLNKNIPQFRTAVLGVAGDHPTDLKIWQTATSGMSLNCQDFENILQSRFVPQSVKRFFLQLFFKEITWKEIRRLIMKYKASLCWFYVARHVLRCFRVRFDLTSFLNYPNVYLKRRSGIHTCFRMRETCLVGCIV